MLNKLLIIILLICPSIASEVTLPKPTGNYAVETKALALTDPTRTNLRDTNSRRFMIQFFYPSPKDATHSNQTFPYQPGTLNNGKIDNAHVLAHSK